MVGSLWTGISGLSGQQTSLDNESNNIANVNTLGYKSSRLSFADQMYQDKIGKGTTILDSEKLYKQGNLKLTGVSYDMALSGEGFFTVANKTGGSTETFYTRAGNFRMGDNGTLQDSAGNEVQGWAISPLNTGSDIISTSSTANSFTDDYINLSASEIIKKSTSIETITTKTTDYKGLSKSDSLDVMTGAGYKSKATKILDVELLRLNYSSKLSAYSAAWDVMSSPAISQNSWLDFDLDTQNIGSGDQLFVYIDGNKYVQEFDTDKLTTMQKLTDQISNITGINAYIGVSTDASYPSPLDTQGYMILEGLVPGKSIAIGDVGVVSNNATVLQKSGTNTEAVEGSGYGAVLSAMEALKKAVAGKQRDIWDATDIGTIGTNDVIKYTLSVGSNTYELGMIEGADYVVGTVQGNLSSNLTNSNKIDMIVEAINEDPNMSTQVVARNINGKLVVEALEVGEDVYSSLSITNYPKTVLVSSNIDSDTILENGEVWTYDLTNETLNTDETVGWAMTLDNNSYSVELKGDNTQAKITNVTTGFVTSLTLPSAVISTNIAEMMVYAIQNGNSTLAQLVDAQIDSTSSTKMNLSYVSSDGTDPMFSIGTNDEVIKSMNQEYSISSGANAEFMQIKTNINQTASKGSLQLRLDTLGISDSAFGEFDVDSSGLITMQQDGSTFAIGQVAIALFNDNRGLEPKGDNLLAVTSQSGAAIFNINNNQTADVKAKTLELSTADLSESLVNLMVAQRAFEANAKSITTSDTILNTLLQLKR
jgi:flagellar hook protein FlgE